MLKLFAYPFACSLAPHIILRERNIPHQIVWTDLDTGLTLQGERLTDYNPKGMVPTLVEDDIVLTENTAVLLWLWQYSGEGSFDYHQVELLSYVATELHKSLVYPLFNHEDYPAALTQKVLKRQFTYLEKLLQGKSFLQGGSLTPADAYLTWVLVLLRYKEVLDLKDFPTVRNYFGGILKQPSVAAAVALETEQREKALLSQR